MGKTSTYESKPLNAHGLVEYNQTEKETWKTLIQRQNEIIQDRACPEFIQGIQDIGLNEHIPQLKDVTSALEAKTGWGVEPVPAIIPAEQFFHLLAHKRFPAANFIRTPEEIDYLKEPDIFHEVYGHCPLLANQAYADYMQEYGKLALKVKGKMRMRLFRLFWFTIEFGLVETIDGYRSYGGGILSSFNETQYAVDSEKAQRVPLDAITALRTPYRIDILQPIYFTVKKLEDLYHLLEQDLITMAKESIELGDFPPAFEPPPKEEQEQQEKNFEHC
jgi:phenylalanine-4-hydroxylase